MDNVLFFDKQGADVSRGVYRYKILRFSMVFGLISNLISSKDLVGQCISSMLVRFVKCLSPRPIYVDYSFHQPKLVQEYIQKNCRFLIAGLYGSFLKKIIVDDIKLGCCRCRKNNQNSCNLRYMENKLYLFRFLFYPDLFR